jgi:dihydropteroate synthase
MFTFGKINSFFCKVIAKNNANNKMFTLNCNGRLVVAERPLVMGIINLTTDSFYDGSRFRLDEGLLVQVEKMLLDGASFIDVGAQSTRPGNVQVPENEELALVAAGIDSIRRNFPEAVISVDTFRARVASEAVAAGAALVNDISGGNADAGMLTAVARLGVPYVCMHIKGSPETMHKPTEYEDITREVIDYFIAKSDACRLAGIHDIIVDPGFGFSKRSAQNMVLLKQLSLLKVIGKPVLVGLSRKSTIYKTLGVTAGEALNGTTVLNTIALLHGAHILRVHDVKEAMEVVKLIDAYGG